LPKGVIAEYPYNNFYIYIVFHKKEGRRFAVLYPADKSSGLKRTTISYARYLMSVKEGRVLEEYEEVDHIDNDKTNDEISNLQILTRSENVRKENATRGLKMAVLRCPYCGKIFIRERRQTHIAKGGKRTFCSRTCNYSFRAVDKDEINKRTEENIIKEFTIYNYKRPSHNG
jgi:hypothetical protein ORF064